jgi:hypothetical protein
VRLRKAAERQMMTDDEMYMEHQICRELGGMTVEEMRHRMSHREFLEHRAYWMRRKAHRDVT